MKCQINALGAQWGGIHTDQRGKILGKAFTEEVIFEFDLEE